MILSIIFVIYIMLLGIIDLIILKDINRLKRDSHHHFYVDDVTDTFAREEVHNV